MRSPRGPRLSWQAAGMGVASTLLTGLARIPALPHCGCLTLNLLPLWALVFSSDLELQIPTLWGSQKTEGEAPSTW